MNAPGTKLWLFAVVAALQLLVPGYMIYRHEDALRYGQPYWFKVGPVDPYDPFRGKYVRVDVEANSAPLPAGWRIAKGEWVYVEVAADADGFARLQQAAKEPPAQGDYLRLRALYSDGASVRLEMPFQRYYAEEKIAPEIEQAYRRSASRDRREAALLVRVKGGVGVIEELYIEGMPVRQYLEREGATAGGGKSR